MIYRIADFNINIDLICADNEEYLSGYLAPKGAVADFDASVNEEDLAKEEVNAREFYGKDFSKAYVERFAILRKISAFVLNHDAFLLHGAVIEYEGKGYLFTAVSGTGKTTHILLWKKCFGKDNVTFINGDKPIIRRIDGRFYAYGSPWCGKEGYNTNARTEISATCFITRDESNSIRKVDETYALKRIFSQIMVNDSTNFAAQFELVGDFIEKIPTYQLKCNMDVEAAKVAYEGMK